MKKLLFIGLFISLGVSFENSNVFYDKNTNLMWQDNVKSTKIQKNWKDANNYCNSLKLGGYNDWRLPNIEELYSLYNKKTGYNHKLRHFKPDWFWTSVSAAPDKQFAWFICFWPGEEVMIGGNKKNNKLPFICVRNFMNKHIKKLYRNNNKNIVIDLNNKLLWEDDKNSAKIKKSWEEAKRYCSNLNLGGYSNWRLPSYKEIVTIIDFTTFNPSINHNFKYVNTTNPSWYWTNTANLQNQYMAYRASFYYGYVNGGGHKDDEFYVRCVKKITNNQLKKELNQ